MERTHAHAVAHFSDAVFHVLPRRRPQNATEHDARMAACSADGRLRRSILRAVAAERNRRAGCDDMRTRSDSHGGGSHRRNARGKYRNHGGLQPDMQSRDGTARTGNNLVYRQRRMLAVADTVENRTSAHRPVRRRTVLPAMRKTGRQMGCRPQQGIVLPLARLARRHHRADDGVHHRPRDCRKRNRNNAGGSRIRNLHRPIRIGAVHRLALRRPHRGRTVARAEKHGIGGMDGAVVPQSVVERRPDSLYSLAKLREQLSNLQK